MDRYGEILDKLLKFRRERDWEKFHKPKELAVGIAIEAAELMQEFQWKNDAEVTEKIRTEPEKIADEIADVASYLFLLSNDLGLDLFHEIERKIAKNSIKYPVEKCFGKASKYTELK